MSEQPEFAGAVENILEHLSLINITLGRIYDTQMALVELHDAETANMLDEAHKAGKFLGSPHNLADNPYDL